MYNKRSIKLNKGYWLAIFNLIVQNQQVSFTPHHYQLPFVITHSTHPPLHQPFWLSSKRLIEGVRPTTTVLCTTIALRGSLDGPLFDRNFRFIVLPAKQSCLAFRLLFTCRVRTELRYLQRTREFIRQRSR